MTRFFVFFGILIITNFTLLSANPVSLQSSEQGVVITISGLNYQITENNTSKGIQFKDILENKPSTEHNLALDELIFTVAVNGDYHADLSGSKLQTIPYIDIASQTDVYGYSFNSNNTTNSNNTLEPHIRIIEKGIQRGVRLINVIFQPFRFDPIKNELSYYSDAKISIRFEKPINIIKTDFNQNLYSFFAGVINCEQIPFLSDKKVERQKVNILLDNEAWYDNTKKYVRLSTHKDGIARINGSEIIKIENYFSGKETKFLHFLFKGVEVPIYIANDNDGVFNQNDEIYFLGRRSDGDTTWFNNYSDESSFFVYYDNQSEGKRIHILTEISADKTINKVLIDKHIEKEVMYSVGFPQDNIETMPGEGWCWQILSPTEGNVTKKKFSSPVILSPTGDINDSLEISCFYASSRWDTVALNHRLSYIFNSDTVSSIILNGGDKGQFSTLRNSESLLNGANNLEVNTFGIKYPDGSFKKPDEVIVDYIRIIGISKPFADNGFSEFQIPYLSDNSKIEVPNFSNPKIVGIDIVNDQIVFSNGVSGTSIRVGTKSGSNPLTSIVVNDSIIYSDPADGLFVTSLKAPEFSKLDKRFYQPSNFNEAQTFLQDLPSGTVIIIVFNSTTADLPNQLMNFFADLGSKYSNSINVSTSWVFAFVKGNSESVKENFNVTGIAGFSEFIKHNNGNSYSATINLKSEYDYSFVFNDSTKIETAQAKKVNFSDLRDTKNQYDYLIIYHPDFVNVAEKLKIHRQITNPGIKSKIVDIYDIYKDFNFGTKSPHAIRNFLKYAYNEWQKPSPLNVVLIGDASYDCRKIQSTTIRTDFIPAYGWPASDFWYTLLDGNDNLAEMLIGRIPISTEKQGLQYLDKLVEYDTIPNNPWTKTFLMLSGGKDEIERLSMYETLKNLFMEDIILPSEIGAEVYIIRKKDPAIGGESEASEVISQINSGAYWITFFGHGSPTVFDIDGWQSDKLNNKGKYGFFSTISCNTADFANTETQSRNEDYVLEPNKGFIGAGGSSNFSLIPVSRKLHYWMLKGLADRNSGLRTYCDVLNYAKTLTIFDEAEVFISQQYCYLGEPLAVLKNIGDPDLYFLSNGNDIKVETSNKSAFITEEDSSIIISGNLYNAGYRLYSKTNIRLIHKYDNQIDTAYLDINGVNAKKDFSFQISVIKKPGFHYFELVADPDSLIKDPNRKNNLYSFTTQVFTLGLYSLDPLPNWNINSSQPEFRFINPLLNSTNDQFTYLFKIYDLSNLFSEPILISSSNEILENESFIEWQLKTPLKSNWHYQLTSQLINKSTGKTSAESNIPFHTLSISITDSVSFLISGENQLQELSSKNLLLEGHGDSSELKLQNFDYPFQILSVRSSDHSPFRLSEIVYRDTIYIPNTGDILGFKVVLISGKDYEVKQIKIYNTWGSEDWATDSSSVKLVEFLKDSVEMGDYVLLATHGESTRLPELWKGTIGSMDSLKAVLKQYGSVFADSFGWGSSFAMVGRKGAIPGTIQESIDKNGDSVVLKGNIVQYGMSGSVFTKKIGPAKKWGKIKINGLFSDSLNNELKIIAFNKQKNQNDTIIIKSLADEQILNSSLYPYIWINYSFGRTNINEEPYLSSISCNFVPTEEFSILQSKTYFAKDSVMRGDSALLNISLLNISKRVSSDTNTVSLKIGSHTGDIDKQIIPVKNLLSDEVFSFCTKLITDNYNSSNEANIIINSENKPTEIYDFNNRLVKNLYINKDNEKPEIKLSLDSIEVKNNDFVSRQPKVKIDILDNSHLEIDKVSKADVFINGRWQNSNKIEFKSFGRDIPLKATLSFLSDSLEYGDNIFRIYVSDATGNRDTLIISVNVSLNWYILNAEIYPNPLSDKGRFEFLLKSPVHGSTARIKIYNQLGQIIRTLEKQSIIGKNFIEWDGMDSFGYSIPSGLYTYLIEVLTNEYVEPVMKKFLIVR